MEVDYSKKASLIIKYGFPVFLGVVLLMSYVMFSTMNKSEKLTVHDAKIAGTFVSVKALANGTLASIEIEDGSVVSAGDTLATVEVAVTEDTIKQLEQNVTLAKENLEHLKKGQDIQVPVAPKVDLNVANGDLSRAEARKDRMEELFKMGAISKVQLDEALKDYEAAKSRATTVAKPMEFKTIHRDTPPEILESAELSVRQAEAAVKRAREDAAATEITSPIDGTFYLANVEEGSEIHAGERLFNIGDAGNLWVEARVAVDDLEKIYLGQLVTYDINGKKYLGTVVDIEPEVEEKANPESSPQNIATEGTVSTVEGDDGKRGVKISLSDEAASGQKPGVNVIADFHL